MSYEENPGLELIDIIICNKLELQPYQIENFMLLLSNNTSELEIQDVIMNLPNDYTFYDIVNALYTKYVPDAYQADIVAETVIGSTFLCELNARGESFEKNLKTYLQDD